MLMLQKNINQYCRELSELLLLRVYEQAMMSKLNVGVACLQTSHVLPFCGLLAVKSNAEIASKRVQKM